MCQLLIFYIATHQKNKTKGIILVQVTSYNPVKERERLDIPKKNQVKLILCLSSYRVYWGYVKSAKFL